MPLLSLRLPHVRTMLRREALPETANGAPSAAAELLWSRNLSWEHREQHARQRRATGLLSLDEDSTGYGWESAGTPRGEGAIESISRTGPLFATCRNPQCETHWLRLWRRRQAPRLEGQWACSPECMRVFVETAVARELSGEMPWGPQPHRHRMPLGLILLAQGWVTEAQLRAALEAQRTVGKGRIGTWLMRQCKLPEERVTRALGMQWGCPMLSVVNHQPEATATLIPRLLLDSFGLLPVRVASGRILYLGFEDRMDAAAALAVARMTGLRVETGVVAATQYLRAHERMMAASFPKTVLTEAGNASAVADILTEAIERVRPHEARLVRLHHYLWLRMWRTPVASPSPEATRDALSTRSGESNAARHHAASAVAAVPRIHQVEDLLCRYVPEGSEPES
ncbi:MAG TPA: hypothetical protein VHX63_02835 [Acidobacteriaceae bacterium]|jgi:hypothetical protein|nr:hypothetical protein [Acidobacteriaceae bacterium]